MNGAGARGATTFEMYERWAPVYSPAPHNALMRAEQRAMCELLPDVAGMRALDLACGTGRYARLLLQSSAGDVVAADFSPAMLRNSVGGYPVRASLTRLPFAAGAFDLVVSGLALGHAEDLRQCFSEIARVLQPRGVLLYSDFHFDAARAGQVRSFRDASGRRLELPVDGYPPQMHRDAALEAGLEVDVFRELRAGIELDESFAGSEEFYRRWAGTPIVLVVRARRAR
ncbi:MAG TPA: class I SAM-dependent methyltransferase [Steroidobacteraceae bacterium]|nr:class I SAM-dependent methyltransferase [Steroidobacteraceae bacterium]